ncbi:MAG: HlyD family efflux transporter periplasmic adaptor subunit [Acetobacteraceae bacterium]|nr:HlyD family efflux transporter periplasmic adaptor subunit [Acetobacteraceae bacterium]
MSETELTRSRALSIARPPLFRPESLQERQMIWLGRHVLALGLPASLSSVGCFILSAAAAALVIFGGYARRVEVRGVVMPASGLIQVTSPAAGWVESIEVHDGQTVQNGTSLYIIRNDVTTIDGDTQQRVLQALGDQRAVLVNQIIRKMKMRGQQHEELQRKAGNLQAQIQQLDVQVAMKEEFVRSVSKNYADFSRFQATGIGNVMATLTQQQNWMRAKDEYEELKSRGLRLQAELIETQFQQSSLDLQSGDEIDGMRSKIADLDQQVAKAQALRSIEIRAPGAGTVTAIASHEGQTVASGARMLTIIPSQEKMNAELLAPSSSIGFILTGQRVLLRYTAFPYQKFGQYWGTVTDVAGAALQPEELKTLVPSLPPADQSKTFYRVIVKPDRQDVIAYGRSKPLRASMQVEAHILLEKRPIYQWILEPLYSLHGT